MYYIQQDVNNLTKLQLYYYAGCSLCVIKDNTKVNSHKSTKRSSQVPPKHNIAYYCFVFCSAYTTQFLLPNCPLVDRYPDNTVINWLIDSDQLNQCIVPLSWVGILERSPAQSHSQSLSLSHRSHLFNKHNKQYHKWMLLTKQFSVMHPNPWSTDLTNMNDKYRILLHNSRFTVIKVIAKRQFARIWLNNGYCLPLLGRRLARTWLDKGQWLVSTFNLERIS